MKRTEAYDLVCLFFGEDEAKATLWWQTPNPMLGGVSPQSMVLAGRTRKLLKFIRTALEENRKPAPSSGKK